MRPCNPPDPRSGSCAPAPAAAELTTLAALVDDYIRRCRPRCASGNEWYASASTLVEAISRASACIRKDGKRESHQRRIPGATLTEFGDAIARQPLARCPDFDELHAYVRRAAKDVHGIGALTVYDVAIRIGAFLRLEPERVYLHAGTRVGARTLGLDTDKESLPVSAFPREVQRLRAGEIEDFLCIYKAQLTKS
jgi:hypothetical protein